MKTWVRDIANFNIFPPISGENNMVYGTRTSFRTRSVKFVCFEMDHIGQTPQHNERDWEIRRIAYLHNNRSIIRRVTAWHCVIKRESPEKLFATYIRNDLYEWNAVDKCTPTGAELHVSHCSASHVARCAVERLTFLKHNNVV